jgi:aminoglycoside phosphotransferase family enzyme
MSTPRNAASPAVSTWVNVGRTTSIVFGEDVDGDPAIVDYAVMMRQLEQEWVLAEQLAKRQLSEEIVCALGWKLAAMHHKDSHVECSQQRHLRLLVRTWLDWSDYVRTRHQTHRSGSHFLPTRNSRYEQRFLFDNDL